MFQKSKQSVLSLWVLSTFLWFGFGCFCGSGGFVSLASAVTVVLGGSLRWFWWLHSDSFISVNVSGFNTFLFLATA